MLRYVVVSLGGGVLFGILDGVVNANPYAQKLFDAYKPIAKKTINVPLGFAVDIFYGFVMAGLFIVLHENLPGQTGLAKGLHYGLIMWFFRVVMNVLSQLMTFKVPAKTLVYILITGLGEMVMIGLLFGLTLKPT